MKLKVGFKPGFFRSVVRCSTTSAVTIVLEWRRFDDNPIYAKKISLVINFYFRRAKRCGSNLVKVYAKNFFPQESGGGGDC